MIEEFGERHLETGDLIVYTSADSVLQIAAHVDEVPTAELYAICAAAREIMSGEHAVGRVIARPFRGEPGAFVRTDGRKDLALPPPARTYMEELQAAGVPVHTVGKIGRCSTASASTSQHKGPTNEVALAATAELIDELDGGFVFTNLVETDQVYGHRGDVRLPRRAARRSTPRSASGSSASTPRATCSSSPPTTAATRRRPAPTTHASTRRCSPASTVTAAAGTTVRLRTSARRCCVGSRPRRVASWDPVPLNHRIRVRRGEEWP